MIELVTKDNPSDVVAHACSKCRYVARSKEAAQRCCMPTICQCGAECKRSYTACEECQSKRRAEALAARYAKAEEVEEEAGMVLYSEMLDRFYYDGTAEYLDEAEYAADSAARYVTRSAADSAYSAAYYAAYYAAESTRSTYSAAVEKQNKRLHGMLMNLKGSEYEIR